MEQYKAEGKYPAHQQARVKIPPGATLKRKRPTRRGVIRVDALELPFENRRRHHVVPRYKRRFHPKCRVLRYDDYIASNCKQLW